MFCDGRPNWVLVPARAHLVAGRVAQRQHRGQPPLLLAQRAQRRRQPLGSGAGDERVRARLEGLGARTKAAVALGCRSPPASHGGRHGTAAPQECHGAALSRCHEEGGKRAAARAARCAGPTEACFRDPRCSAGDDPFGGLGCNAGGVAWDCRFCDAAGAGAKAELLLLLLLPLRPFPSLSLVSDSSVLSGASSPVSIGGAGPA